MDNLFLQVVLIENYGLYIDILLEDPLEDPNIPIGWSAYGDSGISEDIRE